jgi:hypothetical protein
MPGTEDRGVGEVKLGRVSDPDQKLICLLDGAHFVTARRAILLDEDLLHAGLV